MEFHPQPRRHAAGVLGVPGGQAVHLRVEALPDELALPDGEGGLVPEGIGNALCQVIQGVQGAVELVEAALGDCLLYTSPSPRDS